MKLFSVFGYPTSGRRGCLAAGVVLAGLVCTALLQACAADVPLSASASSANSATPTTARFSARGLLVISDADMAATAYGDAVLRRTPGQADTLSVLDTRGAPKLVATLPVSNSVIGWPEVLDVSPDGRFAYVAETRGTPAPEVEKMQQVFTDFPAGKWLTVVDVSQLDAPRQVQQMALGSNLGAARVSRDGRQLASVSTDAGKELVLATLEGGLVKHLDHFALDVRRSSKSRQGARSVAWHPSGDVVAVNVADREVQFISIRRNAEGRPTAVQMLGQPVVVGQTLSSGHFSHNGKFFVVPDVGWGDNASATDFLFNSAGQLVVIAFDAAGQHRVAHKADVGLSPESMAISNDGKLLVAVNMNRTYLPDSFPARFWPKRQRSSLTLASFDDNTGEVKRLQEIEFDGLLPENAVFDTQGKGLAVVSYEQRGDAQRKGRVAFWNVVSNNGTTKLEDTGHHISVTRGAHDLAVLP
jgi:DNA-binding beta-propeller fold protein YncE